MSEQETSDTGKDSLSRIIAERREKAGKLASAGSHPYRNDFRPSHTIGEIRARYQGSKPGDDEAKARKGIEPVDGETVFLAGRALAKRGFGKTVFVPVGDRTGTIQFFLNVDHLDSEDFNLSKPLLDAGDWVGAEGQVFWTKRGEMSLLCKRFHVLTKSLRPLPDKWKGLTDVETRYRMRYLDLAINPEVRDVFLKRVAIVRELRAFLDARSFVEVETPMMHPIIGGAAARPFATHHNALDMPLFMRIAPELYLKRLLVGGFDRVYEINRNFRNEGLSRQHNPEFTMLEFYQAYATYEDLMDLTEDMVASLCERVNGAKTCTWGGVELNLGEPWKRISVREAVVQLGGQSEAIFEDPILAAEAAINVGISPKVVLGVLLEGLEQQALASACAGLSVAADDDSQELAVAFGQAERRPEVAKTLCDALADDLERRVRAGHLGYLIFDEKVEEQLVQPTFLTGFPLAVSPLARKSDDPAYCDRFELFVCGKEIANAFSELNDPDDQRARFQAQVLAKARGADETMDFDEDYCRALEVGMPPAAGEGVGIDRLCMMLTGQDSIRDVILFPQMRPE